MTMTIIAAISMIIETGYIWIWGSSTLKLIEQKLSQADIRDVLDFLLVLLTPSYSLEMFLTDPLAAFAFCLTKLYFLQNIVFLSSISAISPALYNGISDACLTKFLLHWQYPGCSGYKQVLLEILLGGFGAHH